MNKILCRFLLSVPAALSLTCAATAYAALPSGLVSSTEGQPMAGAMVTAIEPGNARRVSVFTDEAGAFQFQQEIDSESDLRIRLPGYADKNVQAGTGASSITLSTASLAELKQGLPAHVWVERVGLEKSVQTEFRVQCMMCHQQGYPAARWPTNKEQWDSVFDRMAHKRALLTQEARDSVSAALLEAFRADAAEDMPRLPRTPNASERAVEITEWPLNDAAPSLHDLTLAADGNVYGIDTTRDHVYRLHPDSGQIDKLNVRPDGGEGGWLAHSIFPAPDGALWITFATGNYLGRLDIETGETKHYKMPFGTFYPHTMRFDGKGNMFFTVSVTNHLGRLNMETGEITTWSLPTRDWMQWVAAKAALPLLLLQDALDIKTLAYPELFPIPYGIDIAPDGKVWFSQFNNRRIGYYDPDSDNIEMIDTPFAGPRRFRIDNGGDLWIPAYAEGRIYRYRPANGEFTPFDLPTGPGDSAYALAIEPSDSAVWICGSNSDTMMRLDKISETFITYPLPSRVTFCRDISFSDNGDVWTSYSNYPGGSIETGSSTFVRLRPLPMALTEETAQ